MTREQELTVVLRRMCEYANHLGNEVLVKMGNAVYAGDFVAQNKKLLECENFTDRMAKSLKAIEDAVVAGCFMGVAEAHVFLLRTIDREKVVLREYEKMMEEKP